MSTAFARYQPLQRFQPTLTLSPDGRQVAYSSNASGQYNLHRQPVDGGGPERLTDWTEQAVRQVAWSPDGGTIAFTADRHGDELHQVYLVPAGGGPVRQCTDAPKVQHELGSVEPFSADGRLLAYAGNDRTPTDQDVLVRDLRTGEVRRVWEGTDGMGVPLSFAPDGRLLVAQINGNTDADLYLLPVGGGEPEHLTPHDGQVKVAGGVWAAAGDGFWLVTDADRDFTALAFRPVGGPDPALRPVDAPEWDVEDVAAARDGGLLVWAVNEDGYSRLRAADPRTGTPVLLPATPDGVISALQVSADGRRVAFLLDSPRRPTDVAVLDLDAGEFRYLTDSRPAGVAEPELRDPTLVRYPSHDGRRIPAYLYLPAGDGPFPVLLSIHGGPEAQERPRYGYSGLYQFLVGRGIGVLAPNVRGSTGYGSEYQKLIHRDWGGEELRDLERAVRYLHGLDTVDKERIAVFGGSFGGFAALSCVSRLPELGWAAGVSVVGPSNLVTLTRAVPPTWRRMMADWVGDPDEDAEFLRSRSPLTYADRITAPLFVIQGAQDPRVAQAESDQIVASLRDRGVEVRYDVYPDEGHGFTKRENELRALGDIGEFVAQHLRG